MTWAIDEKIRFWRTKNRLEVDFVLGDKSPLGIETTSTSRVDNADIRGLAAFAKDTKARRLMVVCLEARRRDLILDGVKIEIFPWQDFLSGLWQGSLIK